MSFEEKRMLYVQYTNPAGYPPLQHSSRILANNGWRVCFVGIESKEGGRVEFPEHSRVRVEKAPFPGYGWGRKISYIKYAIRVLSLARNYNPSWVYVSDPLGAPIGLLLSKALGLSIVYHEHDTPSIVSINGASPFMGMVYKARELLAQRAEICILPNGGRITRFNWQVGRQKPTHCVWNCPSMEEIKNVGEEPRDQSSSEDSEDEIYLHYHGSVVPSRLPLSIVDALTRVPDSVHLRIVGYDTGGQNYKHDLLRRARSLGIEERVEVHGRMSRKELWNWTLRSDIGLSLMPTAPSDPNMRWMVGASNKAFDYLMCGLPLLVSDVPEWQSTFVDQGYARACDPTSVESIVAAVQWYLNHPGERHAMGDAGRRRVKEDWNYENEFAEISVALRAGVR